MTIRDYAFDTQSGAVVEVGIVPEPTGLAVLLFPFFVIAASRRIPQ